MSSMSNPVLERQNLPHVFLFSRKVIAEKVRSQIVYHNIIHVRESGNDP